MDEERKWIRLQEAGLLMFLAMPIVILVASLVFGFTIRGDHAHYVHNGLLLICVLLGSAGYTCLRYGHDKRVELHNVELATALVLEQSEFFCPYSPSPPLL